MICLLGLCPPILHRSQVCHSGSYESFVLPQPCRQQLCSRSGLCGSDWTNKLGFSTYYWAGMLGQNSFSYTYAQKGSKIVAASGKGDEAGMTVMVKSNTTGDMLPLLATDSFKSDKSLDKHVESNAFSPFEGGYRAATARANWASNSVSKPVCGRWKTTACTHSTIPAFLFKGLKGTSCVQAWRPSLYAPLSCVFCSCHMCHSACKCY